MADTGDKTSGLAMPTARACQPTASAASASSQSGIPIAEQGIWPAKVSMAWFHWHFTNALNEAIREHGKEAHGFAWVAKRALERSLPDGWAYVYSSNGVPVEAAQGMAARSDATGTGAAEGNSPTPNGGCAHTPAPKDNLP